MPETKLAKSHQDLGVSNQQWQALSAFELGPVLEKRFADSSCDIWTAKHIENGEKVYIKRVHNREPDSPFWQVMKALFAMDLPQAMTQSPNLANRLQQWLQGADLQVPVCQGCFQTDVHSFALFSELPGQPPEHIDNVMVEQLALCLAALHQTSFAELGALGVVDGADEKAQSADEMDFFIEHNWRMRLMKLIYALAPEQVSVEKQQDLINQLDDLTIARIVPVMMDLRWDQFAADANGLLGIFDLDAFVAAPIELDFVILEYLLSEQQLDHFVRHYLHSSDHPLPQIGHVREIYRTVLFMMNVLGEADYQQWMRQGHYFS